MYGRAFLVSSYSLCYGYRIASKTTILTNWLHALRICASNTAEEFYPSHMIKRQYSSGWTVHRYCSNTAPITFHMSSLLDRVDYKVRILFSLAQSDCPLLHSSSLHTAVKEGRPWQKVHKIGSLFCLPFSSIPLLNPEQSCS